MMVVKKMTMIPVECVVRGYLYGSLFDRLLKGEVSLPVEKVLAAKLPEPYFDPTTKSEVKDEPITEAEIVQRGEDEPVRAGRGQGLDHLDLQQDEPEGRSVGVHPRRPEAGVREEGRAGSLLGDSIGPDEFRMWPADRYAPGRSQDSYDKQPVRDWLICRGLQGEARPGQEERGADPASARRSPQDLIDLVSDRYVHIYEDFTGRKL